MPRSSSHASTAWRSATSSSSETASAHLGRFEYLVAGQDCRSQLVTAVPGDENPRRLVDPHLLDR
jgi:hypothetical protein